MNRDLTGEIDWALNPRDLLSLSSLHCNYRQVPCPAFHVGAGDLNSSLLACMPHASLTKKYLNSVIICLVQDGKSSGVYKRAEQLLTEDKCVEGAWLASKVII